MEETPFLGRWVFLLGFFCVLLPFLGVILGLVVWLSRRGSRRPPRARRRAGPEEDDDRPPSAARAAPVTSSARCPECGTDRPADAPEGLCPQCLLKGVVSNAHDSAAAGPNRTDAYAGGTPALSVEEVARLLPHLEILELLGQGGMGAVYKARQPALNRLVAVKVLPPGAAADPAFAERFRREAKALARLGHPNIVAVHDVGRAGELFYFVMEYVDGVNLRQLLRDRLLTPAQALQIVPQICDALQYAHGEGIVHRDIKPENILLDTKGRVKIADFGLAKLLGRDGGNFTLTGTNQVMGTVYYMAPEQVERPQEVDHRADIYSLGVVFYEILTGELPVGRFPPPSEKAGTDAYLDEVVFRAMEKEPARRYQQASEVKTAVRSGRPAPAVSPAAASVARARVRGPAIALIVAGILDTLLPLALFLVRLCLPESAQVVYVKEIAPFELLLTLYGFIFGPLLIVGAVRVLYQRSPHLEALAIAVVAVLPLSPCLPVGLPAGVWALVVFMNPDVKAAFKPRRENRP